MALIKCSECGREVSDRAERCGNCGFPVSEIPDEKMYLHFYWVGRRGDSLRTTTVCIDGESALTMKCGEKKTVQTDSAAHLIDLYQGKHHLLSENITIAGGANYYIFAYKETMGFSHANLTRAVVRDDDFFKDAKKQEYIPHCPTCGSPRVRPISLTARVVSVSLVGYASKKAGKSFKCLNCGYMW